mmetsp:Transcript_26220/g.47909  ORF Transcript_26220/g.47909 Transcript_26220/m.47909 type:complete len:213 (+) Transcript_26220:438-1076(+)
MSANFWTVPSMLAQKSETPWRIASTRLSSLRARIRAAEDCAADSSAEEAVEVSAREASSSSTSTSSSSASSSSCPASSIFGMSNCLMEEDAKETPGAMNNKSKTSLAHASLPNGSSTCSSPTEMACSSDDRLISMPSKALPLSCASCSNRSNKRLVQPFSASTCLLSTGEAPGNAFSGVRHIHKLLEDEGVEPDPPAAQASANRWSVSLFTP